MQILFTERKVHFFVLRFLSSLLLLFMVFTCRATDMSGVSLNTMRVIYPEQSGHGVSVKFTNNTKNTYLLQSRVREIDPVSNEVSARSGSFIVIPPMTKVYPGDSRIFRVLRIAGDLPENKESALWLSVRMVPAVNENNEINNRINMAVVNNIRLFYRPSHLPLGGVNDSARKLTFRLNAHAIMAINQTTYYIPLVSLRVGNLNVSKTSLRIMVPPLGRVSYSLPENIGVKEKIVYWQATQEDGRPTEEYHQGL